MFHHFFLMHIKNLGKFLLKISSIKMFDYVHTNILQVGRIDFQGLMLLCHPSFVSNLYTPIVKLIYPYSQTYILL